MAEAEAPVQLYRSGCKVRLIVRLEEYAADALRKAAPPKPTIRLKGNKDERSPLVSVPDPDAPPGVTRFLLQPRVGPSPAQEQPKSADDLTHEVSGVIPHQATWKQNGVRTADTLTLALRWIDFPVDPRCCRSVQVFFFLGTVSDQDFARGIAGGTRGGGRWGASPSDAGEPLNLVPDEDADGNSNLRFEGFVDKYGRKWSDGAPLVTFECTDYTRSVIGITRPPMTKVAVDKPIDEAVADYMSMFPALQNLTVEYRPTSAERSDTVPPRLKAVLSQRDVIALGPPATQGGATGGEQQSVWDYLSMVCGMVAHTIRIDGRTVVIQRLSNLMGTGPTPRPEDPYQGRSLPSGEYPARAFLFGRNVKELTVEREFTRKSPKNIEVRSYDPDRKNVVSARFPEDGKEVVNSGPGDGKAEKDFCVVFAPPGVRDKATLKQIAEEVYNDQGRQEIGVHVKTRNLASFGGGNDDPDILSMKVGDAFELHADRAYDDGTLADWERRLSDAQQNANLLGSLGFSGEFAEAYAKVFASKDLQKLYKLKEAQFAWDHEQGISIELHGVNYIVARVDQPTSAGTDR